MIQQRNISLDWIRFVACLLVMLEHVAEFYYVSPDWSPNRTENAFTVGIFNSISRVSVPLFIMVSGYLLLPMKGKTTDFFKRRFTRILFPFIIWSIVYSIYFAIKSESSMGEWFRNMARLPFTYQAEHLWYVYMLIGLYLLTPIISPWLQKSSRRELQGYLLLWAFTTFLPYIRLWIPNIGADMYFNPSPTFYYFSGCAGYMILGHYMRRYNPFSNFQAVVAIIIGWIVTSWVFLHQLSVCETLAELELSWGFCTFNVLLMTSGVFVLLSRIKSTEWISLRNLVISISALSYGIYLCHVLWLTIYMQVFMPIFDNVVMVALCVVPCTFISAYLTIYLLSKLPKSKYLY